MGNINAMLNERLKKGDKPSSKMTALAKQSADGNRSSFSGIFSACELNEHEKSLLEGILYEYAENTREIESDFKSLSTITSEIKAISNQAAILHGERIKKAHTILIKYREGAFTTWLTATYGNRQTPYNFMQYFEFYESLPRTLRPRIELMPRQAIYTLASRKGPLEKKLTIIEKYNGQTKTELLRQIRDSFPIAEQDKRRENVAESAIGILTRLCNSLSRSNVKFTKKQKIVIEELLESILSLT